MPIYEFRCQKCNKQFETLLTSISDDALAGVKCPKCKSHQVKKIISSSSYRLASTASPLPTMAGGCGGGSGFS